MDATPGDDTAAAPPTARHAELLLDAVKAALAAPGDHRLFRAGKLPGLFPARAGTSAEAALLALRDGLLETVRTESKGKLVTEWVRATPRAVAFVHETDSPASVLKELKGVLDAARGGVPGWLNEARSDLAALSDRFEQRVSAVLTRLDDLAVRVDAALRRADAASPTVGEPIGRVVPWAVEALKYLDCRATGAVPLPELFHAVRVRFPELMLSAFHDGLRRLHDVRAVRLEPAADMPEPEHALVIDGKLVYTAAR